jgi:hypothetical protein
MDVSNTDDEGSYLDPMLIISTVTMDLGPWVLPLKTLCCISSRLMCTSTAQVSLAAEVHEYESNVASSHKAVKCIHVNKRDVWCVFGTHYYDSQGSRDTGVTVHKLDTPCWQKYTKQLGIDEPS